MLQYLENGTRYDQSYYYNELMTNRRLHGLSTGNKVDDLE